MPVNHPALLKAENEKLRAAIEEACAFVDRNCVNSDGLEMIGRLRNALSRQAEPQQSREAEGLLPEWWMEQQQAEPECGNCFEGKSDMDHVCRKCGGSGKAEPVEPAPAQDEREAFIQRMIEERDITRRLAEYMWDHRPAQTEQQPVAWLHSRSGAVATEATKRAMEDGSVPSGYDIPLYAAPIAQAAPQPVAVPESWRELIRDTLRNYRMGTLDDGYGGGYPLIDAMTADGQSVSGGIEECTYLADAIWNALRAAPIAQTAPQPEQSGLVESALRKAVAYLDENPFNEIASGSILHRVMAAALSAQGGSHDSR